MAEPKKPRFVDFLTPDQLRRKRENDRKNARIARDKRAAYMQNLESRVRELEEQNQDLQQRLASCQCQNISIPADAIQSSSKPELVEDVVEQSQLPSSTIAYSGTIVDVEAINGEVYNPKLRQTFDANIFGISNGQVEATDPNIDTSLALEMTVNFPYNTSSLVVPVPGRPLDNFIWLALPQHTKPTCDLDYAILDLIQSRRPYELVGGNIAEFEERPFPSIPSLLNPIDEVVTSPVTSTIVTNVINVMTVPNVESNLPEQIGCLYFMSSIFRWLISPTEANFYSMPSWLRPTPAQLAVPHPMWIDCIIWPKARDRMCRNRRYHGLNGIISKLSNESISVNWPYSLSDILVRDAESNIVLNPMFALHIKNLDNWSLGPKFLDTFPELANDMKFRSDRISAV